jgi:hypothetical protein
LLLDGGPLPCFSVTPGTHPWSPHGFHRAIGGAVRKTRSGHGVIEHLGHHIPGCSNTSFPGSGYLLSKNRVPFLFLGVSVDHKGQWEAHWGHRRHTFHAPMSPNVWCNVLVLFYPLKMRKAAQCEVLVFLSIRTHNFP